MIFPKNTIAAVLSFLLFAAGENAGQCVSPRSITCARVDTSPTLDGDLSDWSQVTGISTVLSFAYGGATYAPGQANIKCSHDDDKIYFAIEVPGQYSFDAEDNHKCAAISTMMKMGSKATFLNMGGCPEAMAGCPVDPVDPQICDDYKVDIGGHWELKTTQMGTEYPIDIASGTGDDAVANKDDEFSTSPFCRKDDEGTNAGNEWAGAWIHTSPSATGGSYIFEMSRLLKTASPETDAQLEADGTYGFGIAFWDPLETSSGWTDAGHYVTGCSTDWIDLILGDDANPNYDPDEADDISAKSSAGRVGIANFSEWGVVLFAVAHAIMG